MCKFVKGALVSAHMRRQKPKPLCCFAQTKSPPLRMDNTTWHSMTDLERIVYAMFKHSFPKPFSPESIVHVLSRRFKDLTILDVWRCLDSEIMKRFLFRKTRFFWCLITEQQLKDYQDQFVFKM